MGSFDVYCLCCGAPFYNNKIIKNKLLLKKYLSNGKYLGITPDGLWEDIIELINSLKINDTEKKRLLKNLYINKNYNWLKNILCISKDSIKKIKYDMINPDINFVDFDSYYIHKNCYKLLLNNNIKINFEILEKIKGIDLNQFNKKYPIISKYQGQYFYHTLAYIEHPYLLENPLTNRKNATRILKLIKSNIKKPNNKKANNKNSNKKQRPSPSQSAKLFKLGTKKKGNDGNMWIIKKTKTGVKRWTKIS